MLLNYPKVEIHKSILKIAWPAIAEQTLIGMVGVVSTIFVGHLGTVEIAAVGLINMLVFFLQSIFAGLSTGSTVVIARLTGEGDHDASKVALVQSLFIGVLAGIALLGFGTLFTDQILGVFFSGSEPRVREVAEVYYRLVLIGMPFLVIDMVIAGSLRGSGDTRTPMYVTGIINIINIILSIILIFGVAVGGRQLVPAMGVVGAALAVTAARFCGAGIRLTVLFVFKGRLSLSFRDSFRPDFTMVARIIRVGVPAFLEQFIMQGGVLAMQTIIASIGTVDLASFQVGANVNQLAIMPTFGFAVAATTIVGQRLGNKDYEGAETYATESNKLAIFCISIIGILTFIFARPLASLYTSDPEVIRTGIVIIRIFAFTEPLLGIIMTSSGVLRAAGDILYVTISAFIGLWLFRVVASLILNKAFGLGVYGVMAGVCMDFATRSVLFGLRVRAGKWKYLRV